MNCYASRRMWPLLLLALVWCVPCGGTLLPRAGAAPQTAAAAPAGGAYPHDVPLLTLDGKPTNLSALRGKVVFVNLWASWCQPCVRELPSIEALFRKMDPDKVAFALISFDSDLQKAAALVKSQGYTFPVYFPVGTVRPPFDANEIPATVIVAPDGRVVTRYEGMTNYDTPEFKSLLEGLIAPVAK